MLQILASLPRRSPGFAWWMVKKSLLGYALYWVYRAVFETIVLIAFKGSLHVEDGTYAVLYSRKGIKFKKVGNVPSYGNYAEIVWDDDFGWPVMIRVRTHQGY